MDNSDEAVRTHRTAEEWAENRGPPARPRGSDRFQRTRPQRLARNTRRSPPDLLGMVIFAQIAVLTFVALLGPRRI
jgi:hypothetical protein